ncbi:Protein CBG04198 [Caenorhabditis briggsae]|uniref:Uncharacterized protein n=2 Tax=Caenorhabditis briggsae TaxID=6238 RepID=A0AAE9E2B1_CAEBR|nr:Protein CBG04198 [Caenorhabditis briggsae]UMM11219.1 hypothetical protein L5515_000607 [Caenorhabditis briggsae]CAP24954.1 Protein CBG04198 [Caenorhabditis briggsae]
MCGIGPSEQKTRRIVNFLPTDADSDDEFVKGLPYPYEEACKEIVRRRKSYESADKLIRHAIHAALQLLRTYHFDQQNGILVNCKKRSECSTHLTGSSTNRSSELKIPIARRQRYT